MLTKPERASTDSPVNPKTTEGAANRQYNEIFYTKKETNIFFWYNLFVS